MANITITNHPLIQHKLSILRDKHTASKEFRTLVGEIAMLMCYEATRDLPLKDVEIETPVSKMTTKALAGKKLAFVPILRAGLGMVDGVLTLVPSARVGHIGLYRDPATLQPVEYYCKLPSDIGERDVIVLDPMLATGGSAIDAITQIKKRNPKSIKFMCIIAAPEDLRLSARLIPMLISSPLQRTRSSTITAISFPVSATPETESSARNNCTCNTRTIML